MSMPQYYDNAAKFVTSGYPEPFAEHILKYPNLIVLEKSRLSKSLLKHTTPIAH